MIRILIADDEPLNREVLRELLESQGYEVDEAVDGRDVIKLATLLRPDVVLLDIRMPELDGYSALAKLRAHPGTRDIKIIAVTAFAMDADRQRAHEAGFDAYESKPIDFPSLLQTIKGLVEQEG